MKEVGYLQVANRNVILPLSVSAWGPFTGEANVITTTLQKPFGPTDTTIIEDNHPRLQGTADDEKH